MTVCSQCNGAGVHQGAAAPIQDKKGNSTKKNTDHQSGMASSTCQQCRGTGIQSSFGV